MLRIIRDIKQQDFAKSLAYILSNLNYFHSLEVVDRVSETQLQVGENANQIILGLTVLERSAIIIFGVEALWA